ncbi:MAG: 30S ribosomal protein S20 [Actinomycetota bacterium]
MANIKSQIKRNRQNEARRARNKQVRTFLKTKVKRVNVALESGDSQAARDAYQVAAREFDKAAAKGIIHRNKAANRKSRLARRLNASG